MHNRMEPKYFRVIIKTNKLAHELWHNCSSYEHNIEHNGSLFRALLKRIIGKKLSTIGQSLVSMFSKWLATVSV